MTAGPLRLDGNEGPLARTSSRPTTRRGTDAFGHLEYPGFASWDYLGAIVRPSRNASTAPTIHVVDQTRRPIVEVTGALSGRYELQERRDDGSIVLKPDLSDAAIFEREGGRPMTAEEFERAFGDLPTGPA